MNVLFTYLVAFSHTGGIERFNKCFMLAMSQLSIEKKWKFKITSAYEVTPDRAYTLETSFKGFKSKLIYMMHFIWSMYAYEVIIFSHINLSVLILITKIFHPGCRIVLITHGAEIWRNLPSWKQSALKFSDTILAVSQHTKDFMVNTFEIEAGKIKVFNNTVDPYIQFPSEFSKPKYLMERYGLNESQKVIFTLTRMSSLEQYKGYDMVLKALSLMPADFNYLYILAGKADDKELNRIKSIIEKYNLSNRVLLSGKIPEHELVDHYLIADYYVMPSKEEGFGIVFIEAMLCGLKVIAGNKDGSKDALDNGKLGTLLDPDNAEDIKTAILALSEIPASDESKRLLQGKVQERFGWEVYKSNLYKKLEMLLQEGK